MRRFTLALIIFILLILLFNFKTIFSYLSLPKTYKIEKNEESIFLKKTGIILLNQDITFSPYEGVVKFKCEDLEKVPKDFLVCEIETNEGVFKFYTKNSGIISKRIDEFDLILDELKNNPFLVLDNKMKNKVSNLKDGDKIKEGEPVFRLIDNLEGYIYLKLDNDLKNFINGKVLYLRMDTNNEIFKCEILENEKFLKLKFNKFIEYFINNKTYIFDVLLFSGNVIKIPEKFIKKGGFDIKDEDGFNKFVRFEGLKYIRQNGFYIFPDINENKEIFELVGKEVVN